MDQYVMPRAANSSRHFAQTAGVSSVDALSEMITAHSVSSSVRLRLSHANCRSSLAARLKLGMAIVKSLGIADEFRQCAETPRVQHETNLMLISILISVPDS